VGEKGAQEGAVVRIATYVDENGNVAGFRETGWFYVYSNITGQWTIEKSVPFGIRVGMALSEVKAVLKGAVSQLDNCRVLLSDQVKGALYAILREEMGFRTWKSAGAVVEQLENVARMEIELATREAVRAADRAGAASRAGGACGGGRCGTNGCGPTENSLPRPACRPGQGAAPIVPIGEGHYQLNLAEALRSGSGLNSREILLPFLEETSFQKLEIFCDHVPRWLSQKLEELKLGAEFEALGTPDRGTTAIIFPLQKH
jgi:Fe-only nitrogenase accessory protein AnfO